MAIKNKSGVRLSRNDDAEPNNKTGESDEGFFNRLFSPGTIETDVSGEDYDTEIEGSVGSATYYTDITGQSDDSSDESSMGSTVIRFDKDLRAKHRNACKNMTVGIFVEFSRCHEVHRLVVDSRIISLEIVPYYSQRNFNLDRKIWKSD